MTLVLIGKDLVLAGSTPKIEDKQVPGIHISSCFLLGDMGEERCDPLYHWQHCWRECLGG